MADSERWINLGMLTEYEHYETGEMCVTKWIPCKMSTQMMIQLMYVLPRQGQVPTWWESRCEVCDEPLPLPPAVVGTIDHCHYGVPGRHTLMVCWQHLVDKKEETQRASARTGGK